MSVIRLQEKVPYVYSNQSRDFQLLERAFDCIINGVKFDIDTMSNLTDTQLCRDRILQLLATKLGFYTTANIDNESMRYILDGFPIILKNKGSVKGVEQAIYVFFKLTNLRTNYKIDLHEKEKPNPHIISIWIEGTTIDTTILTEILKYVVPTGYLIDYTFYVSAGGQTIVTSKQYVKGVRVSNDYSARLVNNEQPSSEFTDDDHIIGAVDTMMLTNNENNVTGVLEKDFYISEDNND